MKRQHKVVVWFDEVNKKDLPLVGGKGANLGELTRAGIQVPPGFIVTADSYYRFLEEANLEEGIRRVVEALETNDGDALHKASDLIKNMIMAAPMPADIALEIEAAYEQLGGLVAVRSSATAEDLPEASFAGQQRTFLNIEGSKQVVEAVQGCWASLFEPRAIFYRNQQGFDHVRVGIAVPVQRMVQSDVAGVMFTVEPLSNADRIVIEAVYGLGETIVSGAVTPDYYLVDKETFAILNKEIVRQEWQLVKRIEKSRDHEHTNVEAPIREDLREAQKLSDGDIIAVAKMGKRIERLYGFPQDIEWAKEGSRLYIVQTRPITTIKPLKQRNHISELAAATVLLSGSPASPGMGSGPVRIVRDSSHTSTVQEGDVLVAVMTTPDFVPAMKRAAAIATDRGGRTCHAAIVSRELGIPCVVGTGNATHSLKDKQVITVDGSTGKVFKGKIVVKEKPVKATPKRRVRTRTRVYVNLAEPERADAVAARHVDGVGLLRAEFMIAQIGEHPNYMLDHGRGGEFTEKLAIGLALFANAFYPRPVVYRTTDFKTNEYRQLKGGDQYEDQEENPMLGYRGASRYVRDREAFKLEIEAIKQVRENYPNLWVMIPFVRTPEELRQVKMIMEAEGLQQSKDFKLWIMVEIPSNIFLLDQFLDVGIDGISIGSNDLTQLILGIDRDNERLGEDFDERNEAVMVALEKAIRVAASRGVTSSICGQAPSVYPELTEKLVEWGITSVSVSPDAIEHTREVIAAFEKRLGITPKGGRRRIAL